MNVIYYEIKKNFAIILCLLLMSILLMSVFWQRDISRYTLYKYNHYYFWLSNIGIVYLISKLYIQDFQHGAIKNMIVRSSSILRLNLIRNLNAIVIGGIFFMGAQVVLFISIDKLGSKFSTMETLTLVFNMLIIYMLISITFAAYVACVTYLIKHYKKAYILTLAPPLMFNHFIPLVVVIMKHKHAVWIHVLDILPSKVVFDLTTSWTISLSQFIILFIWIVLFYGIQYWLLKHIEL